MQPPFPCRSPRGLLAVVALVAGAHAAPAAAVDLLQAYDLAKANDGQLKIAKARADASREALPQATAQLWPNVGFSYNYGPIDQQRKLSGLSEHLSYPSQSGTLQLRQPLFRLNLYYGLDQAKWQVASSDALYDRDFQTMGTRVVGAYFDALFSRDSLELIRTQLASYEGQLRAAKLAFAAGTGTRTDIDDIQARYDLLRADEIKARQAIDASTLQLEIYVGEKVRELAPLNEQRFRANELDPQSFDVWLARALDYSPDTRRLKAQFEAASAAVDVATAGHWPTLDLVASASASTGDQTSTFPRTEYQTTYVGVQVNLPIFTGGYVNSQVRQAIAQRDEARESYDYARDDLSLQVRKTFDALKAGISRIQALEIALASAHQMVVSNQKGVAAGTRTTLDVLAAEQQRFNTAVELAKERYQMLVHHATLLGYVGDLNTGTVADLNRILRGSAS